MSKRNDAVRAAHARGYVVTETGAVISGKGKRLRLRMSGDPPYPTFSLNMGGQTMPLPVHRLAAFQKFGERAFDPNLMVRHKNGVHRDSFPSNLLLGTAHDNAMDQPAAVRAARAQRARAARMKFRAPETLARMRALRAEGRLLREIAAEFGCCESTACLLTRGVAG
jgi:hypothetical protein